MVITILGCVQTISEKEFPKICEDSLHLRPPFSEKLFPVHRPSVLKRAGWNFFFMIFENKFLLSKIPHPCRLPIEQLCKKGLSYSKMKSVTTHGQFL